MELDELSGRTHGPTRIHLADYSLRHRRDGNAGTTILYHFRICLRPHSSSVMTAGRRVGGWAPPPLPPGPQDLPRDYGPDGAAGGLSRSTPWLANETTTLPSGAGQTRQSDDRDSEPDYLLRSTRHGQGMIYNSGNGSFYLTANEYRQGLRIRKTNASFFATA